MVSRCDASSFIFSSRACVIRPSPFAIFRATVGALCTARRAAANDQCWQSGFDSDLCCGLEFGEFGYRECFDATYTFEVCCRSATEEAKRKADIADWERGLKGLPRAADVEYDYVVVGSGSGGSAAAAALAADASRPSVLLLEAGEWDRPREYHRSTIVNASMNSFGRPVWWLYRSFQPFDSPTGATWAMRSGLALGGSSAINKGLHYRGGAAELASALQWSEMRISASFRRIHRSLRRGASLRGLRGPVIHDVKRDELPTFLQQVVRALEDAGVPYHDDPHEGGPRSLHGSHSSVWLSLACPRDVVKKNRVSGDRDLLRCVRQSAYSGLVKPLNRSHSNLVISPSSLATRIEWNAATRQASGVEVLELRNEDDVAGEEELGHPLGNVLSRDGVGRRWDTRLRKRYLARARRAVVLAAGTMGSPALLLRSGIGRQKDVSRLGIENAFIDRPAVGSGLRDRLVVNVMVITKEECRPLEAVWRLNDIPKLFAFFNFTSDNTPGEDGSPEAEINMIETCVDDRQAFSVRFILQRLHSSGRVHVSTPHLFRAPHAELPASDRDARTAAAMIEWFFAKVLHHPAVGPMVVGTQPEGDATEFVQAGAQWYLHPTGTLADPSVVDAGMRLRGVGNVRIADASVLPDGVPAGHPDVTVRMLGDYVAHMLLDEAGVGRA